MKYSWLPSFKIADLNNIWDKAPSKAGIYVISCGRQLARVGGNDPAGIIYVGKSLCVRDRLWTYWEAEHEASGILWDIPEVAGAIFGKRVRSSDDVTPLIEQSIVWIASPIPRTKLDAAERAVLFIYTLRFGELPPLNSTLPDRWGKKPSKASLEWGSQALNVKHLTSR
jgi:hypothetical protein